MTAENLPDGLPMPPEPPKGCRWEKLKGALKPSGTYIWSNGLDWTVLLRGYCHPTGSTCLEAVPLAGVGEPKRFDPSHLNLEGIKPEPDGDYVLHSAYVAMEARALAAEAKLKAYETAYPDFRRTLEVGCRVITKRGSSHYIKEIGFGGAEAVAENPYYHWDKEWPYPPEHAAMDEDLDSIAIIDFPPKP